MTDNYTEYSKEEIIKKPTWQKELDKQFEKLEQLENSYHLIKKLKKEIEEAQE